MITVYLAGPIHKCTDKQAHDWRNYVMSKLPECKFRNPMDRDYRGADHSDPELENKVVHGDKADIDASDIVLVNFSKPSVGTSMEVLYSWERGKTVFIVDTSKNYGPLSVWLTYHSNKVFKTMDEAINDIQKIVEQDVEFIFEDEVKNDEY